jgi:hypothetical protein
VLVTSITAQFYTVLKANPSHDATIVNVHFVAAVSAWARLIAAIVIAEVAKTTDEPQAISLHTTNMGGRIVKEWDSLNFVLEGESAPRATQWNAQCRETFSVPKGFLYE